VHEGALFNEKRDEDACVRTAFSYKGLELAAPSWFDPEAMENEMRAKVSALLEAVVAADGVIRAEEREFVRRAASRWKLPEPDAPLSLRNLGSATEALRALDAGAQARVLALLVDAAAVDHDLDPREHALLLAAAASLGIEATALEERLIQRLKAPAP
jgi:uncharacterized tellurite resistance protein B-like protein